MTQLSLNLLCRHDGPSVLPPSSMAHAMSYRDAVLLCWGHRRDRAAGAQSAAARFIGAQVSHMSDYLSDDESKRDMPAKYIEQFEVWCGNCAISQFIAGRARLTVLEEVQAIRRTA